MKLLISWEDNNKILEEKYHHKTFKKFAYLPTKMTNGSVVWLTQYNERTFVIHGIIESVRYSL